MTAAVDAEIADPAAMERTISDMVDVAKGWDTETFANRTVGLLILDKGNLNKYQRTLEIVLEVHRRVVEAKAKAAVQ